MAKTGNSDAVPAKEWFSLACRIFGIWQLLVAAGYLVSALNVAAGFYPRGSSMAYPLGAYMVQVFAHFFLAAWLLKAAPSIAEFFYPSPRSRDNASEEKPSDSNISPI
jgi:hypothetical protein